MYQNAEGYLLSTNGNGCPANIESRCLLQGNGDLKPETSKTKSSVFSSKRYRECELNLVP